MQNPDKLIELPGSSMSTKKPYEPPDFVRNVMGSSAGAGSGEFHVYRHLRRKEMARLKSLHEMSEQEKLDAEFRAKMDEMNRKNEEIAAKKRAKRQKKKQTKKAKKRLKRSSNDDGEESQGKGEEACAQGNDRNDDNYDDDDEGSKHSGDQ